MKTFKEYFIIENVGEIEKNSLYFKNLKILEGYINILEKYLPVDSIILSYTIILHNFIILERYYLDLIKKERLEINKYLKLENLYDINQITKKMIDLYEIDDVRYNVEKINRLKVIDNFLSDNPEIFKKVFTEDEIELLIQSNKYNL